LRECDGRKIVCLANDKVVCSTYKKPKGRS
jgi:hypothetical protein